MCGIRGALAIDGRDARAGVHRTPDSRQSHPRDDEQMCQVGGLQRTYEKEREISNRTPTLLHPDLAGGISREPLACKSLML